MKLRLLAALIAVLAVTGPILLSVRKDCTPPPSAPPVAAEGWSAVRVDARPFEMESIRRASA